VVAGGDGRVLIHYMLPWLGGKMKNDGFKGVSLVRLAGVGGG